MENAKLNLAFQEVETLILYLHSRLGKEGERSLFFQQSGLGSLQLDFEEASKYHKCLNNLEMTLVKADDLSRRSIEASLQKAILKVVCTEDSSKSIKKRLVQALEELRTKLTAKPIEYSCYIPVYGIAEEGLPFKAGKVEFVVFDDGLAKKFRDIASKSSIQREWKQEEIEKYISEGLKDEVCAIVHVVAKDYESAQNKALNYLRITLDILNYFSDLASSNLGAWAYLPGDLVPIVQFSG
jgi:hypothetical protein